MVTSHATIDVATKSTGSVLESLNLTFETLEGCGEVIDAIKQNCRMLMHVRLLFSRNVINCVGEERYAAFQCSYWTQLITADIDGKMDLERLFEVFTKCSNLKIGTESLQDSEIEEWKRIRVLGPRIRDLYVSVIACIGEESSSAISSCFSLSGLAMSSYYATAIEQDIIDTAIISVLSSLPIPSLVWLSLTRCRATRANT